MTSLYQLKNIGFNYGDESRSKFNLSEVNIEIEKSKIIAIVGPNGSGKTSLLNILSFLNLPKKGTFLYDGELLESQSIGRFRKTVGYVQQSPYLLRGTAFKNIELGLKLKHIDKETRLKRVNEVMQLLGITELSDRTARSLSGGEAQKVAIGQVLVLDPEVLILDEPFTHLDKKSIHDLEQLVLTLNKQLNKTIIFTTHDQIQAQSMANDIYSVVSGKVFVAHLVNLFNGVLDIQNAVFNTGKLSIGIPDGIEQAEQIAIDPKQIVISKEKLDSSMQNSFSGKITGMNEEQGNVILNVDINEKIQVMITHKALENLELSIGSNVWISFKSSSVVIF
ncbi:MAG: ABC transporter ATP-binding protein [Proteobacteria bacterium]|nr:ABC transporter ATP-binding protein [Pseudomonadota bacterium]NOG61098.1 ABC transporter ATP-binding protein [Pseudomonadota bacterium]